MFGGVTNAQQPISVKKFWNAVSLNYEYKQMDAGMRSWLHSFAENKTGSYTGAVALLENIEKEYLFQDKVFLDLYCNSSNSKENLKMLLGHLCGRFSLGNPVADYIFNKYSDNPIAKKIIVKKIAEEKERIIQEERRVIHQIEKERVQEENIENEKKNIIHEAEFFGGSAAFYHFIKRSFVYPDSTAGINGTIAVEFTIDTTGKVSNAKIISTPVLGHGLEEEAIRVINLLPLWKPANKNGMPISSVKKQLFKF